MHEHITTFLFSTKYQKPRCSIAFVFYFLILAIGSIPDARATVGHWASGLVLHSLAYALITFFLFTGFSGTPLRKSILAFLIVAIMGALDEYVQSFFPYRTAAISDWLVDCGASFLTTLLLMAIRPQKFDPS